MRRCPVHWQQKHALITCLSGQRFATQVLAGKAAEVNALLYEPPDNCKKREVLDCVCEPTVTIATKEALAAINDMFMSELPHEVTRRKRQP